jgi:MFS family permease
VLLPVLSSETLHASAAVFGELFASFGAGALVGALWTAARGSASWRALFVGAAGFNGALILLAPVRNAVIAAALLLCVGLCFSVWTSNSQSIIQLTSPDALRGRVLGLYLFVFAGLAPIGGLLAGVLADVGGTELALATAGGAGLVATLWAAARLRGVKLPRRREPLVVEEV